MDERKTMGVFTRTYDGDAKWLRVMLETFRKHGSGYGKQVVTGISEQCRKVREVCGEFGVRFIPDEQARYIPNGYINQQYTKLTADKYLDEPLILFVDSDCVSIADHSSEDFLMDGKPLILHTKWDDVGDAQCWKRPTEIALGKSVHYEFMRRLPACYHRSTLVGLRDHIREFHGSLLYHLKASAAFSEFNALGAYAWEHQRDDYSFVNTEDWIPPEPGLRQCWSHGDMEHEIKRKMEENK